MCLPAGVGGDVAGIWRGECQRESSPLVDGAHGSAGLSQRSLLCLTDYYQPPASSSLPTHYSSNSQTLSRFFNLVQARHSICPTSPSPPQHSLPLRRRLLARTHQSPYTVHQAPTPGLPQTAYPTDLPRTTYHTCHTNHFPDITYAMAVELSPSELGFKRMSA